MKIGSREYGAGTLEADGVAHEGWKPTVQQYGSTESEVSLGIALPKHVFGATEGLHTLILPNCRLPGRDLSHNAHHDDASLRFFLSIAHVQLWAVLVPCDAPRSVGYSPGDQPLCFERPSAATNVRQLAQCAHAGAPPQPRRTRGPRCRPDRGSGSGENRSLRSSYS